MVQLPLGLRPFLLATDIGFLAYWSLTALVALGIVDIPQEFLFKDYEDARVQAWNWSFMPLDVTLSLCGLLSLRARAVGNLLWKPLLIISLSLTFCAGLMAISYWAILSEFDALWLGMNVFLMLWPLAYARFALKV